jgi:hypothetical protein
MLKPINDMDTSDMILFKIVDAKRELIEFARDHYAGEIEALAAEYTATADPNGWMAALDTPEMQRSCAEINVSRLHAPEEWKRIDDIEHARRARANNGQ